MFDISKLKRKTFDIDLFMNTFNIYDHKKIVQILSDLEKSNIIRPIKSSELTVKYPQINSKYRICEKDTIDNSEILDEINFVLNNKFKIDYFRNHIDEYMKFRDKILLLNNYFNNNKVLQNISINERSYEIFSNEKYLNSKEGKELLLKLGLSVIDDLNVYLTPEPFFYSSMNTNINQTILITENKDTYITLLKALKLNNGYIFDRKIDTLIYGEGKKIISSLNSIYEDINLSYLNNSLNEFIYWGDIDKEGFFIFGLLKKQFPKINLKLFETAYFNMVNKFKVINKSKCLKKQSENYLLGLKELSNDLKEEIKEILEDGYYIPQEIITLKELRGYKNE